MNTIRKATETMTQEQRQAAYEDPFASGKWSVQKAKLLVKGCAKVQAHQSTRIKPKCIFVPSVQELTLKECMIAVIVHTIASAAVTLVIGLPIFGLFYLFA